jgi:hypothetical protein
MMKDLHRVVICGASLYTLAIESGLSMLEMGDVVSIDPFLPDTVDRIRLLEPDVVIMERNGKSNQFALEILFQNIPLLVLDEAQRSITVLVRENFPKTEISELTNVIKYINRRQFERRFENV